MDGPAGGLRCVLSLAKDSFVAPVLFDFFGIMVRIDIACGRILASCCLLASLLSLVGGGHVVYDVSIL